MPNQMPNEVLKPILCPVLIGRTAALESLVARLDAPQTQPSNVVLVSGEAGIGKSRLIGELCARAVGQGYTVLRGYCFQSDASDAFAPVRDLLRSQFAHILEPAQLQALDPLTQELLQFLPDIVPLPRRVERSNFLETDEMKRWLLTGLTHHFQRLASEHPLLLVFENLHWSDDASLEFLFHFVRYSVQHPLLICLSYRNDEVHPSLARLLVQLDRAHLALEYPLQRLARDEVEAMVQAIFDLDRPVRQEFLEALYALTEGNPFFVEEILKSLIAAGDIFYGERGWDRRPLDQIHIPRSVQDAVQRRAKTLAPETHHTLLLAAVIGHRFDYTLLLALTGVDERQLTQHIKELIAAQLVIEESPERFAFRHALTQQAVYGQLLGRERRAIHRLVADTMASVYANTLDRHLVDLARHTYEGRLWEQAVRVNRRAGRQAFQLYAPRAAYEHYRRAVEATCRLDRLPEPKLLLDSGRCAEMFGDFDAAYADYRAALDSARAAQDHEMEWQVLLETGFLFHSRDLTQAGNYFQQALELARAQGEPARIAHSLNRIGNWHTNLEQCDQAIPLHQEALDIFEELDDRSRLAETYDLLAISSAVADDFVQAWQYYRQAIALFRSLGDRRGLASGLMQMGLTDLVQLCLTEVVGEYSIVERDAATEEARVIASEIGWPAGEAYIAMIYSAQHMARGRYQESWHWAHTALEIAESIEHRMWASAAYHALGTIALEWYAPDEALYFLEQGWRVARESSSIIWQNLVLVALISAYLLADEIEKAEHLLQERWHGAMPARIQGQRLIWRAYVELELARGNATAALSGVERLRAETKNLDTNTVVPRLWYLWGRALADLSRWDEAELRLQEALREAMRYKLKPFLWRIHLALGHLYIVSGRPDTAADAFAAVRHEVQTLLPEAPIPAMADSFEQHVWAQIPTRFRESPTPATGNADSPLTRRESEVARLVAQGTTNREIATQLVISERTAETHVRNILGKLDFTSRAQIAVWVAEQEPRL